MGKGSNSTNDSQSRTFTWAEIKTHTSKDDSWIVIDGTVYDVTRWQKKHPGGARILSHVAGQDATDVWYALHPDKEYVTKYMKPISIGQAESSTESSIQTDFRAVRKTAEEAGWFRANLWFYAAHLGHVLALEAMAIGVFFYFGTGWLPYLTAVFLLGAMQAQAGWSQHDYGHLSVFRKSWLNHAVQTFIIGHIKAASQHWWQFKHSQHHAKTNVHRKDPDISLPHVFLLGDKIPAEWGKQKRGKMPYQHQQHYFWFFGPLTLISIYFHFEILYFILRRKDWLDLAVMLSFFARFYYTYLHFMSMWQVGGLYLSLRVVESFWFTFVTQMSHLPMEIDRDQEKDWVTSQTITTCNIEPGWFNDWFSGHLNYQIEHHIFPTMPRHNFHKVAPMLQSLCRKHNLPYTVKPLSTAFADIFRSLRKSGQIWYDTYYHQ